MIRELTVSEVSQVSGAQAPSWGQVGQIISIVTGGITLIKEVGPYVVEGVRAVNRRIKGIANWILEHTPVPA